MGYIRDYYITVIIDGIKDLDRRMARNRRNYKRLHDEVFLSANEEMKERKQRWIKELKDKYNFVYGKDTLEYAIDLGEFADI